MNNINQINEKFDNIVADYEELIEWTEYLKIQVSRKFNINEYQAWLQGPGFSWASGLTDIKPSCPVIGWRDQDMRIVAMYGTANDL